MIRIVLAYVAVLAGILVLDAVWLGLVARQFYADQLGSLIAPQVQWWAAGLFYLLFAGGVVFFAVAPHGAAAPPGRAFGRGAFFGLVAYATYDLTSQAMIRDWPLLVTVVDLGWGAALTGAVSAIGAWAWRRAG